MGYVVGVERRCGRGRGRTRVGHVVARLPWATLVWLSGSGVGGWGWVSIFHLSPSISSSRVGHVVARLPWATPGRWSVVGARFSSLSLDLHFTAKREEKKTVVLLVCDFLTPGLCVNFLLVGKQSLFSTTAKLKLFSLTFNRTLRLRQNTYLSLI
jgi:hypothetical protein